MLVDANYGRGDLRNSQESRPLSTSGSAPSRSRPPSSLIKLLFPEPVLPARMMAAIGADEGDLFRPGVVGGC